MTTTQLPARSQLEHDIPIIGEENADTITYSLTYPFTLTRACRNHCPYCSFQKRNENLTVPYSTIKLAKKARALGIREGLYIAGERPDRFSQIRSMLDLWGFNSYLDYVYTVCELGFLEGLIPVIEGGFFSPIELKKLSEVCALTKIMIDPVDHNIASTFYAKSPGKKLELRLKLLEWAGKLQFPTSTGIIVGIGTSKTLQKEIFNEIAKIHNTYGTIHDVTIQNFVPEAHTPMANKNPASQKEMLDAVELALNLLPSDITITVPIALNPNIEPFISAGIRDLGQIIEGKTPYFKSEQSNLIELEEKMQKLGYSIQQRFPLKKSFIRNGLYSKKLGQVFDAYRYKIKKETQETKPKESR